MQYGVQDKYGDNDFEIPGMYIEYTGFHAVRGEMEDQE
jgi:hypothetical protein